MVTLDFLSDINKDNYYSLNYGKVDRQLVKILWWHFAALLIGALAIWYWRPSILYPTPFSWRVISLSEALWTIGIGLLASIIPTILMGKIKNHYLYRIIMTFALLVYSYLLVFVTGGSIEAH